MSTSSYLDRYKTVAPRLCKSGVKSWVVFGDNDEIGLQDHERSVLEACATVTLAKVPGTHMFLVESPAQNGRGDRGGGGVRPALLVSRVVARWRLTNVFVEP